MRLRAVAACCLLALTRGPGARADPPRYDLRGEAGAEHDTNAGRVEIIQGVAPAGPMVGSPLGRVVLSADLWVPIAERQTLALTFGAAGKRFVRDGARNEDVIVAQASGTWAVAVGRTTTVALLGGYYDVFQRPTSDARDFRSVTPMLRIEQGILGGTLSAGGGHRWFTYKPAADFSFAAPSAFLLFRRALVSRAQSDDADWEWNAGATIEWRGYAAGRCPTAAQCPAPSTSTTEPRIDRFATAHFELVRTGDLLVAAGLAGHINRSNSYGESLTRGLVHLRAVALLPWHLSMTGRAELVLTRYGDSVPLARNTITGVPLASIEDESRSVFRVEMVRTLGQSLDVGVRYTLYTNEFRAGPVDFRRQTFLLFAAFGYGNDR